jgi:hypothetical protein
MIADMVIPETDAIILPERIPGQPRTAGDVREAIGEEEARRIEAEHGTEDNPVLWERLLDLAEIAEAFGGELRRSKPETFQDKAPWYIAIFERDGIRYVVAMAPKAGRGTYMASEFTVERAPQEVLEQRRKAARALGAISVRHSAQNPSGEGHVQLVLRKLDELHARAVGGAANA